MPGGIFCSYQQADSKISMGRQRNQNSKNNFGKKSWRTHST